MTSFAADASGLRARSGAAVKSADQQAIRCLMTPEGLRIHPLPVGIDGLERLGALLSILTPLSRPVANPGSSGRMEISMKHLGTVKSFDETKGRGLIEADSGGEYLVFERSGIYLNPRVPPVEGQRLTYELGTRGGQRCAVNLRNV